MKIVRVLPWCCVLCEAGRYAHTSFEQSTSVGRKLQTSPGRIPVSSCRRTMSATIGGRCGSVASTTAGSTGSTGSGSHAVVRPDCRPVTVARAW